MSIQQIAEPVAVWTESGKPVRLLWSGTRYVVNDTPTPIRADDELCEALTHPIARLIGWRFQAASSAGESYVFDVLQTTRGQWELARIYS